MPKPLAVLNIEDSEGDSGLIVRLLKKAGYKTTLERVETAEQMRSALKTHTWDIIISDHGLPQFDSFSALALLHEEGLDIPFIAVADATGEETAVAIMKAGAHDYLIKDNLTRLVPAVERELEQTKIRRERKQIESMYRTLTENSIQGIAIFQGQKMVFANPALSKINGYANEELMAMSAEQIFAITHPDDRAVSQERMRRRMAGETVPPNTELRMIRKDGSIVWVHVFNDQIEYEGQPAILSTLIDITERKQAEEELRASEKRFRALIVNGLDDISLLTADGTLIWESPSVVRNLLYAPEEFLGRNIFELLHPDDLEPIQNLFTQLVREPAGRQSGTFRLSRKDGTWRWIEAIATNMLNEPSVQAIVINYRDVTEQWQAKNTIRESEDRYRDLVENSQDLICTHNMEGLILSANPASARILGYEPGELTGRNLRDFLAPETQGHFKYYLSKLGRHGSAKGLLFVHTKSGERRIWEYQNTVRSEGLAKPVVRGMAHDITERKQVEDALHESEERFKSAFQYSAIGMALVSLEGRWLHVNSRLCSILGYSEDEFLAKTFQDITHPGDLNSDLNYLNQVVAGEIKSYTMEKRYFHKDGRIIWAFLAVALARDNAGAPLYFISQIEDITERKQAEATLQASEARWRTLIQNLPAFIAEAGPDGTILALNRTQPGFSPDDYVGKSLFDVVAPESRDQFEDAFIRVRNEAVLVEYEAAGHGPYQEPAWYNRQLIPIAQNGEIRSILMVASDITERKKMESALIQSEQAHRTLFENVPVGLYRASADGRMLDANPAMVRIFGYQDRESFLTVKVEELYANLAVKNKFNEDVGKSDIISGMEVEFRKKDGTTFWAEDNIHTIRDEQRMPLYYEGSLTDITERKRGEQILAESEERFRQAIAAADAIPYSLQYVPRHYNFMGEGIHNLAGYSFEEMTPALLDTLIVESNMLGAFKGMPVQEAAKLVRDGKSEGLWQCEHRIRNRSGEERWLTDSSIQVLGEDGIPTGSIGIFQDITERKQAEIEIKERTDDTELINSLNEAINRGESLDSIIKLFAQSLVQVIGSFATTFYLPSPDGNALVMQNIDLTHSTVKHIERLIGGPIPKIEVPIREGSYFHRVLHSEHGLLSADIETIHGWLDGYTETKHLPKAVRGPIRKLIPQINKLMNIRSIISIPLVSEKKIIALFDVSSSKIMTEKDLYRIQKISGQLTAVIQRKQADTALRESENRYTLASRATNDVIWEWNLETDLFHWNENIQATFGYAREEIEHFESWWQDHIHPQDRSRVIEHTRTHIERGESILSDEYRFQRKDGSYAYIIDRGYVERDESGKAFRMIGAMSDITKSKQAEAALRESEQRYHALFEDMPVSIWEEDFSVVKKHLDSLKRDGIRDFRAYFESNPAAISECNAMIRVLDVNQAALKMYRATSKKDLLASVGADPNERLMEQLREVLIAISDGRNNYTWEGADETVSGEPIEISLSWSVAADHEVDFSRVIVTTIDVTARKQAEQALRMSEQRYHALFEDMPVSIWEEDFSEAKKYLDSLKAQGITDIRTYFERNPEAFLKCATEIRILDVNQATLKMYRAKSKEDLYKSMDEGLNESEVEHITDALIAISEGKATHGWEGTDATVTGEPIEISLNWTVAPGHELDFSKVIVTTLDITDRKQAEAALRASEAQFRALFEGAAIGIALVDLTGHPVKVNSALEEMLGYEGQELRRMAFTDFTHPDDATTDWELWQELVSGKRESYQIEKRFVHKDKHIIWVKLTGSIVPGASGEVLFGVGMVEDISERKKAEAESKYQLSELEALYENGLVISRLLEPKQIAQRMVELMDQKLQWHHAAIRIYDTFTDNLELLALNYPGFDEAEIVGQIERINQTINTPDKGLSGWVIRHGEVVRIGKLKDDTRYIETYANINSGLYVPIKSGDRILGSIAVESEQENAFTERDETTLTTLANQAAIAFINARLYTWLKKELDDRLKAEEEIRKLNIELEQRVAERTAQIEATKRRLELATHAGQIGVWEYIPRENKVIWDERMHIIHQMPASEFDGTSETWGRIMHPDDLEQLQINRQLAFTKNLLMNDEHRIIWPDGSIRHIMASAVMAYSTEGTPERIIGINMDITDRKQIEASLRESENYARLLFDAVPDPVSVTDADGLIVDVNKEFEKQFNAARNESRGKRIGELGIYPDGEIEKRDEYVNDVLQGRAVKPVELDFYVPGDRIHTLELHSYLLKVNGRQLILNTSHDITAHKKAEEAQRIAKSEMERALRIKNEFLANMSHELRTPLNSILGISESLEEQIAGTLNEKQLKYLGIVRESGRHLLELINDILDLSKIEAGRMELDIHRISVETLCQSSLRMVKELSQKKSLHVSYQVHGDIKIIQADQRRLKQALVNLLSNAVKFTPEGKEIGLEVKGSPGTNEIAFTVWDQGVGIATEDMKLLFKPFVQLDAGLAREYQGTGLGLALVAQMINLHGGRVNVESETGKGSRFTITLPWAPNEQAPKAKVTAELSLPGPRSTEKRNGRILLVEDTDVVVQLITEYLRYKGYEIILAQNGVEAIRLAAQERPDLILMDVMMPIMDGLEATKQIRADTALKNIPIIALTALAMTGDSERCLAAGMNDYLSKPIQMQDLADMIEKYMRATLKESDEK